MTCSSDGAGFDTGRCALWFFSTSLAPRNLLKSTSTSARSAGASTSSFTGTGTSHIPPSAPICRRAGPPMSRLRIRALQPFRMRNRYIRGSTSRNGQTLPPPRPGVPRPRPPPRRAPAPAVFPPPLRAPPPREAVGTFPPRPPPPPLPSPPPPPRPAPPPPPRPPPPPPPAPVPPSPSVPSAVSPPSPPPEARGDPRAHGNATQSGARLLCLSPPPFLPPPGGGGASPPPAPTIPSPTIAPSSEPFLRRPDRPQCSGPRSSHVPEDPTGRLATPSPGCCASPASGAARMLALTMVMNARRSITGVAFARAPRELDPPSPFRPKRLSQE